MDAPLALEDPHRMTLALAALSALCLAAAPPAAAGAVVRGVDGAKCTSCHKPTVVTANAHKVVHPSFKKGACGECHRDHGKTPKDALAAREPELCTRCHADPKYAVAHRTPAASRGQCTTCHGPHAADRKGLVAISEPELCTGCHKELAKAHDGYAVQRVRCWSCHLAHSKAGAHLLPASVHQAAPDCGSCHGTRGSEKQFAPAQPDPKLCLSCHVDQAAALERRVVHAAVTDGGCSSCHVPHASPWKGLLTGEQKALCLECHSELEAKLKAKVVHGAVKDGRCHGCHEPHGADLPKLVRAAGAATCITCHPKSAGWTAEKSVHDPVKRGACRGCHEPHGGEPKLLVKEGRALCLSCHTALGKRLAAKGAVVHAPVEDDCAGCHVPHASDQPSLLQGAIPALCADCHDTDEPGIVKKHGGLAFGASRCTGCHDPHVGKAKGIVHEVGHVPVTDGMCDACHVTAARPIDARLKDGGMKLCADCHEFATLQARPGAHQAVRDGDCFFGCHAPHASATPHLLSQPVPALCVECHGAPDPKVKAHARLTAQSRCSSCHDPHAPTPVLRVPPGAAAKPAVAKPAAAKKAPAAAPKKKPAAKPARPAR